MPNDLIQHIRDRQVKLAQAAQAPKPLAVHRPQMLYIGCIDARLDPTADIGIPRGEALIFRNIGALVRPPLTGETSDAMDAGQVTGNEIPESVSIGAALEFFINGLPAEAGKLKHIVISGHTDCGGIRACLQGTDTKKMPYLTKYMKALKDVRDKVMTFSGLSEHEQLHKLEEDSVRSSLNNLLSYKVVQDAIEQGRLEVHGWLINTASHRISELDTHIGKFIEMSKWPTEVKKKTSA